MALSRAVEQLHIISNKQLDRNGNENLRTFSGLFINHLKQIDLWSEQLNSYTFGNPIRTSKIQRTPIQSVSQQNFISNPRKNHTIKILTNSGYLWDTKQQKAIEKGNLIHLIMSRIKTKIDIDASLNTCLASGIINNDQLPELQEIALRIVEHPQLLDYFDSSNTIYNERDIITRNNTVLRPDRLVINEKNQAVIIDYKTGLHDHKYIQQLEKYKDALTDMGFEVLNKVLVYVNDQIEIKEF